MAKSCITFSDKDFEKVKNHLPANLRKAVGDNKALAEYILSKADISISAFLKSPNAYRQRLNEEKLLLAIQEKKQLDKMAKELALQKSKTVLGKKLIILKPTQTRANTVANNPDTIQIFEDNAQAYTATHKTPVVFGDTMIQVDNGPTLNIGSDLNNPNSAKFRTDSNGEIIPNSKGFIMKKNAQDKKGNFISTAESLFTNADRKAFEIANQAIADEIKELLEADNKLEEGKRKYHKVQMLPSLGLGQTSALPLQLAKDLQSILEKTLGIHTTLTVNSYMSTTISKETGKNTILYGLKVDNLGKITDKTAEEKKEAAAKKRASEKKELNKEVNESRQALRPLGEEERLQPYKNMALSLLSKIFPNMTLRRARINWLANRFSDMLTSTLEDYKKIYTTEMVEAKLQEYNEGKISADEYNDFLNNYYGLTRNDEQAQRLWALNNISLRVTDEQGNPTSISLIEAIFNNINTEMQNVYNVVSEALLSSDKNTLNEAARGIFMGKYAGFSSYSQVFMERAERAGWSEKTQLQKAREQLLILKDAYEPFIQQPALYKALQVAANEHLTFNEGIRLSLEENKASREASDSLVTDEKQENEEEGLAEDRSGLNLIKYKTLNPRNTLSVRIKRLLNSIDLVKMDQYGNKTFVYDDLGFKTKLNASYAFYILAQELSGAFTPQAFEKKLEVLTRKYAWAEGLVGKLNEDTEQARDLKREMYRSFYLIFTPYAMITNSGAVKALNRTNTISSFLNSIQKNYETHLLLGDHSIYDANGLVNQKNVEYVHSFFDQAGIKNKDLEEKKPFLWAIKTLGSPYRIKVNEAMRALKILRGELEDGQKYALFSFLNNIGIDTSYINLNEILPYITEETLAAKRAEMQEASEENVSELAAFRSIFTSEMSKNLSDIWSSIDIITNTKYGKGFREGQHLVSAFNGAYTQIAKALPVIDEGFLESNFTFNGKQRNSYCPPDFISRFCTAIQTLSQNELEEWLDNEYGQYDFFKHNNEWNLPLLKELVMNPSLRKRFSFYNILGIGTQDRTDDNTIQNVADEKMLEGLISAFWSQRSDNEGNEFGLYRTALLSDADALVTIVAPRYTTNSGSTYQEQIVKRLAKVLQQETERIIASRAAKNTGKTGVIVENYNDKRNNSGKFVFFSELEVSNTDGVKERKNAFMKRYADVLQTGSTVKINKFFQEEAQKIIEKRANEFLQSFTEEQLIKLHEIKEKLQQKDENSSENEQEKDSTDNTNELDDTSTEKDDNKDLTSALSEAEREKYQDELKEFFYNDYYMQSQLIELFGGDLAQYKNLQDFIKRNKQSYSAGQRMWSTDENGNEMKDRAIFLEDSTCLVNDFTAIKELLFSQPGIDTATRGIINRTIAIWKAGTCETDGQAFRTLPSLRRLLKALGGKWTDEMEDAYNRIMQGRLNAKDFIVLWNAMKPFVYTHESRMINGRRERVNLQYKNSEYLMTGLLTALGTQLQQAPYLRGLHRFMNEHNVDIVQFHSAVKIGCNSMFDINYKNGEESKKIISEAEKNLDAGKITQEEYNTIVKNERYQTEKEVYNALEEQLSQMNTSSSEGEAISDAFHETPLSDYMVMQPTEDHMLDNVAIFGSQLRNIIPADLSESFQVTINGVTMNRDTAIKYYNALITDQMLDSFAKVNKRFANPKVLSEYLQEMAANNPKYSPDIKAAFELDEEGNFNIPLNSPSLTNKVEDLLLSAYKNNVTRQKIKGGNAVLVSNYGVSDQLHIKYNNNDAKQGIEYIECYMPFYAKDMYQNFLESKITKDGEVWTINYEKVEQAVKAGLFDENLLKIIGYRIPTEDKYSIMPIKIKGFLPLTAGSMIMLPSDIITMSGTDFDIDKLFLMLREYETSDAGKKMNMAFNEYMTQHYGKDWQSDERFVDEAKFVNKYEHTFKEMNAFEDDHQDTYSAFLEEIYAKSETDYNNLYYNLNGVSFSKMKTLKIKEQLDENGNFDINATSQMKNQQNSFKRYSTRNNALIDIIWGIMTSPEGSRLAFYPGDFSSIKQSAAEQKILTDVTALTEFTKKYAEKIKKQGILATMHSMSQEELDTFFDEYSSVSDPLSIMNYMSNHRNLMDGNALIGASAINSSFHYKFQFLNLSIKEANQFNVKLLGMSHPKKVTKIDSQLSELTGERVGRTCAEFQAAAPDNGKTPCLGYMGVNLQNMGFAGGMARLGFDISSIGVILKSADLVAVGEELFKSVVNTDRKKYSFKMFGGDIAEIVDKLAEFRMNPEQFLDSAANQAFAMRYASWYNNLKQITSDLKSVQVVAKSDSTNNALPTSVAEVLQQQLAIAKFVENVNSDSFSVVNLDKAIDTSIDPSKLSTEKLRQAILKSPIPRLQAAYTLGIVGGRQQVGQYLPYLNNTTLKAILTLQNRIGLDMSYASQTNRVKRFCAELTTFLLSKNSIFSDTKDFNGKEISQIDQRNYYIHDFPVKFQDFIDQKDENGEYKYPQLREMSIIKKINNASGKGITIKESSNKTTIQVRQSMMEEFNSIFFNENNEISNLGFDLIMYCYYSSGFNYGHSNLANFITTAIQQKMPTFVDALNRGTNEWLNADDITINSYVDQFMLNNYDAIPRIKSRGHFERVAKNEDNGRARIRIKKTALFDTKYGNYLTNTGHPKKFLSRNGHVYMYIPEYKTGSTTATWTNGALYEEIPFNKTSMSAKDLFGNETVRYAPYYKRGVSLEDFFSDLVQLKDYGKITTTSFKNSKDVMNYKGSNIIKINTTERFTRENAEKDSQTLYIFMDNTDRSSGSKEVSPDSWYFKKYAIKDEETGKYVPLYYPEKSTTAVLRGLPNAMPLSTQRWYHEGAKGKEGNWTDDDIKEFREVISSEIEAIKKAWSTNKYNQVKIGNIFNSRIANISEERTPVLYKYLSEALSDLYSTIDSSLSNKETVESKALNSAEASLATSGEAAAGVGAERETDLDDTTKKTLNRLDAEEEKLDDSTKRLIDKLDAEEEVTSINNIENDEEIGSFNGAESREDKLFSINEAETRENEEIISADTADNTDLEERAASISNAEDREQQEAIAEVQEAEEEGPQDPENRICK